LVKWIRDRLWTLVGLGAVVLSIWLLVDRLRGISLDDVVRSLTEIAPSSWILAGLATLLAYAALAGYDRVALMHLRRRVPWRFIAAASFTAYAIGHNVGASVLSGGVVRYRAYSSKGLTAYEIAVLVAFCSFTFALGAVVLGGIVLLLVPDLPQLFFPELPGWTAYGAAALLLGLVMLYVAGSALRLRPLRVRRRRLVYPRLPVVWRQLLIGPIELIGAAAIIHFALPEAGHPGFLVVLGVFLASFSIALLSHAPGGLGVLEFVFLLALPGVNPADVIAALLVFRLLYLLLPLALSILFVVAFEHAQHRLLDAAIREQRAPRGADSAKSGSG
jgi:uncharacterized membrane protein YbhN (UPF0104 family)